MLLLCSPRPCPVPAWLMNPLRGSEVHGHRQFHSKTTVRRARACSSIVLPALGSAWNERMLAWARKRAPLRWYLISPLNHLSRHHFLARRDSRTCARYSQTHVQSLRKRLRSRTLMILQERAPTTLRLASGIFMYTTEQRNILSCALGPLEYTSLTWINTSESITSFRTIPHTSCIVMC